MDIVFVFSSYLLGSVPHLYWLGRLRGLRLEGDLHLNLWNQGGRVLGTAGMVGDLAKGATVVLVGRLLELDVSTLAIAGLAVVSGQMWPVFFRFDGEKGNSVGIALAATLTPLPFLVAFIPMAAGILIRMVLRILKSEPAIGGPPSLSLPLGMAVGFLVLPFAGWALNELPIVVWSYFGMFVLIMIRRATAGIRADLVEGRNGIGMFVNRILYDRSEI